MYVCTYTCMYISYTHAFVLIHISLCSKKNAFRHMSLHDVFRNQMYYHNKNTSLSMFFLQVFFAISVGFLSLSKELRNEFLKLFLQTLLTDPDFIRYETRGPVSYPPKNFCHMHLWLLAMIENIMDSQGFQS